MESNNECMSQDINEQQNNQVVITSQWVRACWKQEYALVKAHYYWFLMSGIPLKARELAG